MRTAQVIRNTSETQIELSINLDGKGESRIETGCGFLDHMLTLFSRHGRFDLTVKCTGDTNVDYHHTTEDIGIALGQSIKTALGDKKGIVRYGDIILPMDEALILSALDISARGMCVFEVTIPTQKVGNFDTELVKEFFDAFSREAGITLHIRMLSGVNSHHIIEGIYKAVGRALKKAVEIETGYENEIPSTKGVI